MNSKITVRDIAGAIEETAPKRYQEDYDNAGLQVGDPDLQVAAVLLCLDVTEDIFEEALRRGCNMIVSHHPLIFRGIKELTGRTATERIIMKAIRLNIAIYAAHTNLDAAREGVSHEIANILKLSDITVLDPRMDDPEVGIGVIGSITPVPKIEFLRKLRESFGVKSLRFSANWPGLVVKRVAVCGGAGAYLIPKAIAEGADAMVTGDVKYHDFTSYGLNILIADIGHYESELCSTRIFSRIIKDRFPECILYFSERDINPIGVIN